MEPEQFPKWQKEIEEIIRRKFPDDSSTQLMKEAGELFNFLGEVEIPAGDVGDLVLILLKKMSAELRPLAAVFSGFKLGMAFERHRRESEKR